MKFLALAVAVSGVVAAGSLNAQTLPARSGIYTGQTTGTNCSYNRTQNTVGDIVFGRTNVSTNCRDVYSREDGSWYQVGQGRNNNSIYERRVRNANGNLVIQRARRNPNGTLTILSSRVATSNDREWSQAQKDRAKAYRKEQKAEDKAARKDNRNYNHR
ncbi:MAG TPA: hypothetical protein VGG76_10125 [Gemmatimonadaceae bacterium]|jgi:hypothetical protein